MAQGTAVLDFGAFPGSAFATVNVTGQTAILSGSLAEAWIRIEASADHLADEHLVDPPAIRAGEITAGVGFPIYGYIDETAQVADRSGKEIGRNTNIMNNNAPLIWGRWNVNWAWA